MRRARRIDAMNAYAVDVIGAGCRCDGNDFVTVGNESSRKILQVQLDTADSRMIPVAHERDFHRRLRRDHHARDTREGVEYAIDLFVAMLRRHGDAQSA